MPRAAALLPGQLDNPTALSESGAGRPNEENSYSNAQLEDTEKDLKLPRGSRGSVGSPGGLYYGDQTPLRHGAGLPPMDGGSHDESTLKAIEAPAAENFGQAMHRRQ